MATLEKIRSKSIFLLIIIGVALLAFILTDFLNSGRSIFGTGTTIAKVDGHKIDVIDFQRRVEERSHQLQAQNQKVDIADIQAQVLNQMITEALYDQEVADLGLVVTDRELSDFMLGDGAKMLDGRVQQETGSINSVSELYDMISNPAKYGVDQQMAVQLKNYASTLESDVEKQLIQQKFANLFNGTIVANELDAKAMYDDGAKTLNIVFAKQDFSTLPDDQYAVSDAEIQAEYDRTRNNYRLNEETRTVSYVTVDIQPSPADMQAATKKVEDAIAALNGAEGASGLADNNEFVVATQKTPAAKITDRRTKSFLDSAAVGSTRLVSQLGNDYTVAKLLGKTVAIDSVNIDFIAVQGKAQLDSLLAGLNDGSIARADAAGNAAVVDSRDSLWVSLFDPQVAGLKEQLLTASTGVYFTPDTAATEGGRIFRIRNRRAEVPVYEYVTAQFTAEPSNATVNSLLADLNKFVAENKNAADFAKNAEKAGYQSMEAIVTPSSVKIGNLPESRGAVRWAMLDAKKGEVSDVFGNEETGRYLVVAVNDIYKGDFVPATEPRVKEILETQVRNDKKAADLIAKYNGKAKDIAGYATLMGTQVDTTQVNFGQPMIAKLGMNQGKLAAKVATSKQGQVVAPVQANNGVVAFVITSVDDSGRPYTFEESAAQFNRQRGGSALMRNMPLILMGRNKVTNNALKFFGD